MDILAVIVFSLNLYYTDCRIALDTLRPRRVH